MDRKSKSRILQRLEGVHDSLCRPYGTRGYFQLYPGLTPWAKLFRRPAAGLRRSPVHRFPKKLVLVHALSPSFVNLDCGLKPCPSQNRL